MTKDQQIELAKQFAMKTSLDYETATRVISEFVRTMGGTGPLAASDFVSLPRSETLYALREGALTKAEKDRFLGDPYSSELRQVYRSGFLAGWSARERVGATPAEREMVNHSAACEHAAFVFIFPELVNDRARTTFNAAFIAGWDARGEHFA